jgi:CDP-diglyceride synthetase
MKVKDAVVRFVTMCTMFSCICAVLYVSPPLIGFILVLICNVEWLRATSELQNPPPTIIEFTYRVAGSLVVYTLAPFGHHLMTGVWVFSMMLIFLRSLYTCEQRDQPLSHASLLELTTHMTGSWAMYMFSHSYLVYHGFVDGVWAILFGMVVIGVGENGALVAGLLVGSNAKRVTNITSPKKSVQGFWGQVVLCTLTSIGYHFWSDLVLTRSLFHSAVKHPFFN